VYGVDHPMKTAEVVSNFRKSMVNKYGVDCALKNPEFIEKGRQTKKLRYDDENYNNRELTKITSLAKYGVNNPTKNKDIQLKISNSRKIKHFAAILELCDKKNITPMFTITDYVGYDFSNKYRFQCKKCNHEFVTDVYKHTHLFCETCNPNDSDTLETELFLFISSIIPAKIEIRRNDRTVLFGKELDIYIPFKKTAFELNGLYWHSENSLGINKQYHINKYKSCEDHHVRLMHIFENEWIHKKNIVKSIIRNSLGCISTKIFARDCVIKSVTTTEKNNFLNENHLQGEDLSSVQYGLFFENELVSVMTFGKSRFDKTIQYEMYRYCNKLDVSVVGGAGKLFSHFISEKSPTSIVSYNDKRYFTGVVYEKLGFQFVKNTPPNYWYVSKDYKTLFNRIRFQKHKLSNLLSTFDANLTEWDNMKNNGYDRIWDCGNGKWLWTNNVSNT
jgi:hypothetical protein